MTAEAVNAPDVDEMMEYLVENADKQWSILKLVEEANELAEVTIKYLTKRDEAKPPVHKILEEYIDVLIRGAILLCSEMNEEEFEEMGDKYLDRKVKMIYNYVKAQKDKENM
jgi:hypothetical protein